MTHIVKLAPLLLLLLTVQSVEGQSWSDVCEVYAMDVLTVQKAIKEFRPTGDEAKDRETLKAAAGITIIGTFSTKVGENVLATRTFRLPVSKLSVTASVSYSERSMVTVSGRESIVIGLAIADKPLENAQEAPDNAVAQTMYDDGFAVIRVNKHAMIEGRQWQLGLECRKPGK